MKTKLIFEIDEFHLIDICHITCSVATNTIHGYGLRLNLYTSINRAHEFHTMISGVNKAVKTLYQQLNFDLFFKNNFI